MSLNYTKKSIGEYIYLLKNKIGDGAYSQVFKGNHQKTGEEVAIKVISLSNTLRSDNFKNVEMEINTLHKLKKYSNIVSVKSVVQTKSNIYIITQYCNSGNLRQWIKKEKRFSQKISIDVIQQIINGYRSISRQGFIHRDIKPDNIFVNKSEIKIGDFGFVVPQNTCGSPLLQNIGSPLYMAPEALISCKYSFESDIWAIGLIFYEMLKGVSPWKAKTQRQLKKQLIQNQVQQFLPTQISKKSKQFLMKTLQSDPAKRMTLDELLSFQFVENLVEENKICMTNVSQNKNEDESTITGRTSGIHEDFKNQCLIKKRHATETSQKSNKSAPNLAILKQKKLQSKKTVAYNNEYENEIIVEAKDKLWLNNIEKQQPLINKKDSNLPNLTAERILKQKTIQSSSLISESQKLIQKNTSEKFIQKSTSMIFDCKQEKSYQGATSALKSSLDLKELPQLNENQDEQEEKALKIIKYNKLVNKNRLITMPSSQKFYQKTQAIKSYRKVEQNLQNDKCQEQKCPFDRELKQIASQISYVKYLNQIIKHICSYLKTSNDKIQTFKNNLFFLVLQKLDQLKNLKLLRLTNKQKQAFMKTKQYDSCSQLIISLEQKYTNRYSHLKPEFKSHKEFISTLSFVLALIHKNAMKNKHDQEQMNRKKIIVIVLDSLINFSSLYFLDKQQNWLKFHQKSNISEISSQKHPNSITKQYCQSIFKRYNQLSNK